MNDIKNSIDLKIKIADKILIINRYIMLTLVEKREKITVISHIFDRKLLLTNMFSKIPAAFNDNRTVVLKNKLVEIKTLEESILDRLMAMKIETGEKIKFFQKITTAIKAYKIND